MTDYCTWTQRGWQPSTLEEIRSFHYFAGFPAWPSYRERLENGDCDDA